MGLQDQIRKSEDTLISIANEHERCYILLFERLHAFNVGVTCLRDVLDRALNRFLLE